MAQGTTRVVPCRELAPNIVTFKIFKYERIHYSIYRDEFNGIKHDDIFIKESSFACHLGNVIGSNPNQLYDFVINKFITWFNGINVMFKKASLFKTFCMNLYGCLFWDFSNEKKNIFLDLPYTTHSRYLNDVPVEAQLFKRVNNAICK